jgi:hypothetical protein
LSRTVDSCRDVGSAYDFDDDQKAAYVRGAIDQPEDESEMWADRIVSAADNLSSARFWDWPAE